MADKTMVNVAFPTELLKKIDRLAEAEYTSRSDYIRRTMVQATKRDEEFDEAFLDLLSADIGEVAQKAGYKTDEDFARLSREIKQDRAKRR